MDWPEGQNVLKVFQNLRVSLHTGLPIVIDPPFKLSIYGCYLAGVWARIVVVGGALGYTVNCFGMLVFAAGGEHAKVGEDIILSVAADPGTAILIFVREDVKRGGGGLCTVSH